MGKRVFVSPLDWGVGHVSRCVPVIKELKHAGHEVILGITSGTRIILDQEFPQEEKYLFPENSMHYWYPLPAWMSIAIQTPAFIKKISEEKKSLDILQKKINADVIISDNRYGCYADGKKNILITHQLNLPIRFLKKIIQQKLKSIFSNFNEIWVPDYEQKEIKLSGELSHHRDSQIPVRYVYPLTRLTKPHSPSVKIYDYCILISGPEKWRTHFEKEAVNFINSQNARFALIRGTQNKLEFKIFNPQCMVIDFADKNMLEKIISASEFVVCRSGYSTIMDLVQLQKPAFLYPTPGQPEQHYLSRYLSKFEMFQPIKRMQDITSEKKPKFIEGVFYENLGGELKKAIESL